MLPTQQENPNGLHKRYIVNKADGSPEDPNAIYFVLRLDNEGDDKEHIACCRAAAREYIHEALRRSKNKSELDYLANIAFDLRKLVAELKKDTPSNQRPLVRKKT